MYLNDFITASSTWAWRILSSTPQQKIHRQEVWRGFSNNGKKRTIASPPPPRTSIAATREAWSQSHHKNLPCLRVWSLARLLASLQQLRGTMDGNKDEKDDEDHSGDSKKAPPAASSEKTASQELKDVEGPQQSGASSAAGVDNITKHKEAMLLSSANSSQQVGSSRPGAVAVGAAVATASASTHPSAETVAAPNDRVLVKLKQEARQQQEQQQRASTASSSGSGVSSVSLAAAPTAAAGEPLSAEIGNEGQKPSTTPSIASAEKSAMNILTSGTSSATGQIITPGAYPERIVVDDNNNITLATDTNALTTTAVGAVGGSGGNPSIEDNHADDASGSDQVATSREAFRDEDIATTMVLEATLAPTRGASSSNSQQEQPSSRPPQQSLAPLVEAMVAPKDDDEELGGQHGGQEEGNGGGTSTMCRMLLLIASFIVVTAVVVIVVLFSRREKGVNSGLQSVPTSSPTMTSQPTSSTQPTSTPSALPTNLPTSILQTSTFEWKQVGTPNGLVGVDPADDGRFGHCVAISGDGSVVVGGAPGPKLDTIIGDSVSQSSTSNTEELTNPGRVEVYKLQQTVANFDNDSAANEIVEDWVLQGSVLYGSNPGDEFGTAVATNFYGDVIAVSSIGHDHIDEDDNVRYNNVGLIQMYRWDDIVQEWAQIGGDIIGDHKIYNNNDNSEGGNIDVDVGTFNDGHLGQSLALSADGNIMAAGGSRFLKGEFENPNKYAGYVRIYQLRSADDGEEKWEQLGNDIHGDLLANDEECGFDVELDDSGYLVVIGCPRYDNHVGRVMTLQYSFEVDDWVTLGWNSNDILVGSASEDYFGGTVDITGDGQYIITGSAAGYAKVYQFEHDEEKGSTTTQVTATTATKDGNWIQVGDTYASPLPSTVFHGTLSITNENGLMWIGSLYLYLHNMLAPGFLTAFRFVPDKTDDGVSEKDVHGQWVDLGQDFLTGEQNGDNFGISSDLSRNGLLMVVGADGVNNSRGRIEVYRATRKND